MDVQKEQKQKLKGHFKNLGTFAVKIKESLLNLNDSETQIFLKKTKKKWSESITEEITSTDSRSFIDIFIQIFVYISFWAWLKHILKENDSGSFQIIRKKEKAFYFLESFGFFF